MTSIDTLRANRFKFRAWRPDSKKMIYPHTEADISMTILEFYDTSYEHKSSWSIIRYVKDNLDKGTALVCSENGYLMQSTGLLDKNGVEIYEGDVVKSYGFFGPMGNCKEEIIGKVEQSYGNWVVPFRAWDSDMEKDLGSWFYETKPRYVSNIGDVWDRSDTPKNDLEIIGNIYEIPDLLK